MKKLMMVKVADLCHAPWNPRKPEELMKEHAAMRELVDSVMAQGVIQPIAVWNDSLPPMVIAGNRRMEAARIAGFDEIPALVFSDIDEETAKAVTRIENEIRLGINPLEDAKLIDGCMKDGLTQKEIAKVFGVSEATICRRVKLLGLSPDIVKAVGEKIDCCDNAALIALAQTTTLDEKSQKKIASSLKNRIQWAGRLREEDVRVEIGSVTCDLNAEMMIFSGSNGRDRMSKCLACGRCSGNQPDLFDDPVSGLGKCLDMMCYRTMENEAIKDICKTAADKAAGGESYDGVELVSGTWDEPYASLRNKKPKGKSRTAYVVFSRYSGGKVDGVRFGMDKKHYEDEKKKREIERKREREEEESKLADENRDYLSADEKVRNYVSGCDDEYFLSVITDAFNRMNPYEVIKLIVFEFDYGFSRAGTDEDDNVPDETMDDFCKCGAGCADAAAVLFSDSLRSDIKQSWANGRMRKLYWLVEHVDECRKLLTENEIISIKRKMED